MNIKKIWLLYQLSHIYKTDNKIFEDLSYEQLGFIVAQMKNPSYLNMQNCFFLAEYLGRNSLGVDRVIEVAQLIKATKPSEVLLEKESFDFEVMIKNCNNTNINLDALSDVLYFARNPQVAYDIRPFLCSGDISNELLSHIKQYEMLLQEFNNKMPPFSAVYSLYNGLADTKTMDFPAFVQGRMLSAENTLNEYEKLCLEYESNKHIQEIEFSISDKTIFCCSNGLSEKILGAIFSDTGFTGAFDIAKTYVPEDTVGIIEYSFPPERVAFQDSDRFINAFRKTMYEAGISGWGYACFNKSIESEVKMIIQSEFYPNEQVNEWEMGW